VVKVHISRDQSNGTYSLFMIDHLLPLSILELVTKLNIELLCRNVVISTFLKVPKLYFSMFFFLNIA
jgi:hypothetical protein